MTNLPVSGVFYVTAIYGQTGKYWSNGHKGIDLVSENGMVYCSCDGIVKTVAYDDGGWGQYVRVIDDLGFHHIFCHLKSGSVKVKAGDRVSRLSIIGTMGKTGNASGVHLHYQLNKDQTTPVDPTQWLGIPNIKGTYNSKHFEINKEKSNMFKDDKKIPVWAYDSVKYLYDKGVIKGDTNGNFRPDDKITRAEFAVALAKAMKVK